MNLEEYEALHDRILEKIVAERKSKKISQKQMGEVLGVNQTTYSDMERGKVKFSIPKLLATLDYLGIDLFSLKEQRQEDMIAIPSSSEEFLRYFTQQTQDINELKSNVQKIMQALGIQDNNDETAPDSPTS
jgi:transcriptional regulator with XRE-family HTH domain